MNTDLSLQTPDAAKSFLVAKIVEQATNDSIPLSGTEKGMLLFSEVSPCHNQTEIAHQFEIECDDTEYEAKIAALFRHAYEHDKQMPERSLAWKNAMRALKAEDFYALVMVDQAGIPRPKSDAPLLKMIRLRDVLFGILALGMLAIAALVLTDKLAVMRPLPDWAKIILCGVCVYGAWRAARPNTQGI